MFSLKWQTPLNCIGSVITCYYISLTSFLAPRWPFSFWRSLQWAPQDGCWQQMSSCTFRMLAERYVHKHVVFTPQSWAVQATWNFLFADVVLAECSPPPLLEPSGTIKRGKHLTVPPCWLKGKPSWSPRGGSWNLELSRSSSLELIVKPLVKPWRNLLGPLRGFSVVSSAWLDSKQLIVVEKILQSGTSC